MSIYGDTCRIRQKQFSSIAGILFRLWREMRLVLHEMMKQRTISIYMMEAEHMYGCVLTRLDPLKKG